VEEVRAPRGFNCASYRTAFVLEQCWAQVLPLFNIKLTKAAKLQWAVGDSDSRFQNFSTWIGAVSGRRVHDFEHFPANSWAFQCVVLHKT